MTRAHTVRPYAQKPVFSYHEGRADGRTIPQSPFGRQLPQRGSLKVKVKGRADGDIGPYVGFAKAEGFLWRNDARPRTQKRGFRAALPESPASFLIVPQSSSWMAAPSMPLPT